VKHLLAESESGQALVEYALIFVLVILVAFSALVLFGPGISGAYQAIVSDVVGPVVEPNPTETEENSTPGAEDPSETTSTPTEAAATPTPTKTSPKDAQSILQDFLDLMKKYKETNGYYAQSWGDKRYSDLGLDASDWSDPVAGIYWNPNGDKLGLGNVDGDNYQVYVTDTKGKEHQVYDGWNIWCIPSTGKCYYHTVAPGHEVDINTMVVKEEEDSGKKK
jgi:Flp pilus assembly pilin Flp